ncbi:LysR family transcriptional regulator [Burkholderia sp. LMG 21824]|uniref:LysR family transcriptional regulator n=1 Tax=Burkholderia sp. LMG 21824 TaxID=3158172 RepID=UPI003C2FC4C0
MDFKRLEHVLFLAEELNFSRAAERANLSQTAFSRSIQAFETELGYKLFDRDTRSVRLTLVGKRFVSRGKKLLADANDIAHDMSLTTLIEVGDLSFGVSPMAMDATLRCRIVELRRQYPGLHLNVEVASWGRLREQLVEERIEFFVSFTDVLSNDPNLIITPLAATKASVFCRADHPLLAGQKVIAAQALLDYPWAAVQMSGEFLPRLRAMRVPDHRAKRPLSLACSSFDLLRDVVLGTDTLLWSWHHWLDEELKTGQIVDIGMLLSPTIEPVGMIGCGLVRLAGRTCSPSAHMAMQFILDGCSERRPPVAAK